MLQGFRALGNTAYERNIVDFRPEENRRNGLDFAVEIFNHIIHIGAFTGLIYRCMMKIPAFRRRLPIGEILYSLRSVGKGL